MQKSILIVLSILVCVSLASCKITRSTATGLHEANEKLIKEAVSQFYLTNEPYNKGELKIYNAKEFKDKYLVLTEKYFGQGERRSILLLIDKNYNVIAWTSGYTPINKCFSINKVDYDGNTILFGNFNNVKWDSNDKKISININKIEVGFSNEEIISENVSIENGYIIVTNPISQVEKFNLYNENNELQSSLEELEKIDTVTEFEELKR